MKLLFNPDVLYNEFLRSSSRISVMFTVIGIASCLLSLVPICLSMIYMDDKAPGLLILAAGIFWFILGIFSLFFSKWFACRSMILLHTSFSPQEAAE